jgi:hypothetical protein
MPVAVTADIRIDRNRDRVKGLSEHKAGFQFECCVWCMTESGHENGSTLSVTEGSNSASYSVSWSEGTVDLDDVRSCIDQVEAAEYGAEAIALSLSTLRTDCTVIKKAWKRGGGFDYWIGHEPDGLFQGFARLEISGIFEERGSNTVSARIKQKLQQLSQSEGSIPGLAIIVEFHAFAGYMVWKNGH